MTPPVAPTITYETRFQLPNRVHVNFIRDPEAEPLTMNDYAVIARLEAQKAGYSSLTGGFLFWQIGENVAITFTEKRARR